MAKKVTLYTNNEAQSTLARNYLISKRVDFQEINTAKEGSGVVIARYKMPFLEVKSSHAISTVAGFSEFQYASALDSRLNYVEFIKRKRNPNTDKQTKLAYKG